LGEALGDAFGDAFGDGAFAGAVAAAGSAARALDFFFFITLLGAGSRCVCPAAGGATASFLAEAFLPIGPWPANGAAAAQPALHPNPKLDTLFGLHKCPKKIAFCNTVWGIEQISGRLTGAVG